MRYRSVPGVMALLWLGGCGVGSPLAGDPDARPRAGELFQVILNVRDMGRQLDFYRDVMGLTVVSPTGIEDYLPPVPSDRNNFAFIRTIVNDRVGNVRELFYDLGNRLVMAREHTGRAPDPDAVTTDTEHRPVDPLRDDDPEFFETRYEYDDDSLVTRIVHPNGNEEAFVYDDSNENRRAQGNLLVHCGLPGLLGGDQARICESFEYDDG